MNQADNQVIEGTNALGFSLLNRVMAQSPQNNVLLSPFSITSALAMVQNGAAGQTRSEIARVLGVEKLDETVLDAAHRALLTSLKNAPETELLVANSLWLHQDFTIKPDFQKRTQQTFDAEVSTLDFAASNAPQQINDWVAKNTKDKITQMIEQLAPDDRMVLMNAVYFRGDWLDPFEKDNTRDEPFFAPSGKREVPMMGRHDHFNYLENADLQLVSLPYKGERMEMYLLLPRQKTALNALLAKMDAKSFGALIGKMSNREGSVSLPRFKMSDDITLRPYLEQFGIKAAFSMQNADFSPIAPPPLWISGARHKAVIEIDETGTEAAAATSIGMAGAAAPNPNRPKPFSFIADHPFLLALRDKESGALLFMGAVNEPETLK